LKHERLLLIKFINKTSLGKKEPHINFKAAPYILVSGKEVSEMVLVNKNGLMVQGISVSGLTIKRMAKVNSYMWTEMSMMVNGHMIKLTDMVSIGILMVQFMRENGRMICNMVRESKLGMIRVNTSVNMLVEPKMELAAMCGQTLVRIMDNGRKIKFKELEFILGLMIVGMEVSG